jgi:hypothetical protein
MARSAGRGGHARPSRRESTTACEAACATKSVRSSIRNNELREIGRRVIFFRNSAACREPSRVLRRSLTVSPVWRKEGRMWVSLVAITLAIAIGCCIAATLMQLEPDSQR